MPLNNNIYNIFKNAFEQRCVRLIVEAYRTSLNEKVIELDWDENDISQELYEKIEISPRRLNWNITAVRELYLTKTVNKTKGFADKLPRIDLRMSSINSQLECKYYCEAKRIKEHDSKLKRAYINEGMDRFISEKYPYGCMVGYIMEGDTGKTIEGINSLLHKDNRSDEILKTKINKFHDSYYESVHPQIQVLKHFMFNFT